MRRSRTALTAWPAFADLMTILAVVGLAVAAGLAIPGDDGEDALTEALARNESLEAEVADLERQLAEARERNTTLTARIEALEEQQRAAARDFNAALAARIETLEQELEDARARELAGRLGHFPCLGTRTGSQTAPVPLLRIVVAGGPASRPARSASAAYRLTPLWPPGADVDGIPRLHEAVAHGLMPEGDLQDYARGMYEYGDAGDTYGRSCRFFVELQKDETTPLPTFTRAYAVLNQYFLFSNSSEVNRILRGTE